MADIKTTIAEEISRIDGAAETIKKKTVEFGLVKDMAIDGAGTVSLGDTIDIQARAISKIEKQNVNQTVSAQNQEVAIPKGYHDGTGKVIVKIPDGNVGIPEITVSDGGLITATSIVGEGYVKGGQTNNTKQLNVKKAETIIPGTTDKTISAKQWLTGMQTIKAVGLDIDANQLVKGNTASIKSNGTTVASVSGNLTVNYYITGSAVPTENTSGDDGDLYLVI